MPGKCTRQILIIKQKELKTKKSLMLEIMKDPFLFMHVKPSNQCDG
jgi:hypothetical protein